MNKGAYPSIKAPLNFLGVSHLVLEYCFVIGCSCPNLFDKAFINSSIFNLASISFHQQPASGVKKTEEDGGRFKKGSSARGRNSLSSVRASIPKSI